MQGLQLSEHGSSTANSTNGSPDLHHAIDTQELVRAFGHLQLSEFSVPQVHQVHQVPQATDIDEEDCEMEEPNEKP